MPVLLLLCSQTVSSGGKTVVVDRSGQRLMPPLSSLLLIFSFVAETGIGVRMGPLNIATSTSFSPWWLQLSNGRNRTGLICFWVDGLHLPWVHVSVGVHSTQVVLFLWCTLFSGSASALYHSATTCLHHACVCKANPMSSLVLSCCCQHGMAWVCFSVTCST